MLNLELKIQMIKIIKSNESETKGNNSLQQLY